MLKKKKNKPKTLILLEEQRQFNSIKKGKLKFIIKPLDEGWRKKLSDSKGENSFREFDYVSVFKKIKNKKSDEVILIDFIKVEIQVKKRQFIIHLGEVI